MVDYKPRGLEAMDYSKVVAGGYVWMFMAIPLESASFTLPEVDISKVNKERERERERT